MQTPCRNETLSWLIYFHAICCIGLVAFTGVNASSVQISFVDLTPSGVTLAITIPDGDTVTGVQFQLGNLVGSSSSGSGSGVLKLSTKAVAMHEDLDASNAWPATGSTFQLTCNEATGVCLGFDIPSFTSLASEEETKSNVISKSGKLIRYIWEPTLGAVWLDDCLATGPAGPFEVSFPDASNAVNIQKTSLEFVVGPDDMTHTFATIQYKFTDHAPGHQSTTSGVLNIAGISDGGCSLKAEYDTTHTNAQHIQCTFTPNQQTCSYRVGETEASAGDNTLVKVFFAGSASGNVLALSSSSDLAPEGGVTDVQVPAPMNIPKMSIGFTGSTSALVDVDDSTCEKCSRGFCCTRKRREATVSYQNLDAQVSMAGFQLSVVGPQGDEWFSPNAELLPGIRDDFVLSNNFDALSLSNSFVVFSMTGAVIPTRTTWHPLIKLYFTYSSSTLSLELGDVITSDKNGVSLRTIVVPGKHQMTITACPTVQKGGKTYCLDVDDDCDCCLNRDDEAPEDPTTGCQICGNIYSEADKVSTTKEDASEIDIVDVVRTANVYYDIDSEYTHKDGDANGDGITDRMDILKVVREVLLPSAERKRFPLCEPLNDL